MWPPKSHWLEKSGVIRDNREKIGIVEHSCHLPHSMGFSDLRPMARNRPSGDNRVVPTPVTLNSSLDISTPLPASLSLTRTLVRSQSQWVEAILPR